MAGLHTFALIMGVGAAGGTGTVCIACALVLIFTGYRAARDGAPDSGSQALASMGFMAAGGLLFLAISLATRA